MGCLLGCRDISVAIAATLSSGRSPFLRIDSVYGKQRGNDNAEREKAITNKEILEERAALFKMVGNSDHVMLGKAFLLWKECGGAAEKKSFCNRLGLASNSMREILALNRQLDSSLTTLGFHPSEVCNINDSSWRIVRSVLVASLSPTQVARVQRPSVKYTEVTMIILRMSSNCIALSIFSTTSTFTLIPFFDCMIDSRRCSFKGRKGKRAQILHT
jgi:hypothetical protein